MSIDIQLTQGLVAFVDDEDFGRVNQYKWRAIKNGKTYLAARMDWNGGKQKSIKMHRFILNAPDGVYVDHINFDTLDNRKCNLRLCSPHESSLHRRKYDNHSISKYKGTVKHGKKWQAMIKHNYKTIYLGTFETEMEAAKAYDVKARELFGEFSHCNFNDCQPKEPARMGVCKNCIGLQGNTKSCAIEVGGNADCAYYIKSGRPRKKLPKAERSE